LEFQNNKMLIQVNNITKKFSIIPVFKDLTLTINKGNKIWLVGMKSWYQKS